MLLVATVALFIMSMPAAYEARRIFQQNLMNKNQLLLGSLHVRTSPYNICYVGIGDNCYKRVLLGVLVDRFYF